MKNIKDTKRFLVGWGGNKKYPTFFISHRDLPETQSGPIPTEPIDLARRMIDMIKGIEKSRKNNKKV